MLEGKTSTGFSYTLDERIKKDWRLVKTLGTLENGSEADQITACVNLLELLFEDKGKALEEHVAKNNDGFIPVKTLMDEVSEILKSNDVTKKS